MPVSKLGGDGHFGTLAITVQSGLTTGALRRGLVLSGSHARTELLSARMRRLNADL